MSYPLNTTFSLTPPPKRVDVAISVYGKPFQTAVTLLSLLATSKQHIDRIFVQIEASQPYGSDPARILPWFGDRLVIHRPKYHLGVSQTDLTRLHDDDYRHSIRYQYAWEKTDKSYLFITHNDCRYTGDFVGGLLSRLADQTFSGAGHVGQCWNCPAKSAGLCDGSRYTRFNPTYAEAIAIVEAARNPARTTVEMIDPIHPMPFPECRLNEVGCLVNLDKVRKETVPEGDVCPFATFTLDIGTLWFRTLVLRGHRFLHWTEGMHHGWALDGSGGYAADLDKELYDRSEQRALAFLRENYAAFTAFLLEQGMVPPAPG